jgi:hypothetical protein
MPDRQRVLLHPKPGISIAFYLWSIIGNGLMGVIPDLHSYPRCTTVSRDAHRRSHHSWVCWSGRLLFFNIGKRISFGRLVEGFAGHGALAD